MFLATFLYEVTLYAIDIDKNRFKTAFLTLENHFKIRTSIAPSSLQHLQVRHSAFHFKLPDAIDRDDMGPCRPLRLNHKVSSLHSLRLFIYHVQQHHGCRC